MSAAAIEAKPKSQPAMPAGAPPAAIAPANGRRPAPAPRPPTHDADAAWAVVLSVIRRIEGYLDEETVALDTSINFDFKASNDRKSQGLLDLNQALRRLQSSDVNADVKNRLAAFRAKLAVNLRKIRLHLDAVKEIAAMLSDAIQSAESDGTYTRNIGPYRSVP
jgi:hypothetical protein